MFDNVTILFSDVVGFTSICSQISPMEVVCMLNAMYTKFDQLSERHGVYKVSKTRGVDSNINRQSELKAWSNLIDVLVVYIVVNQTGFSSFHQRTRFLIL